MFDRLSAGPFIVIIEAENNLNIGKYGHLKIARGLYRLNLTDIKKISIKGRNKIGIEFLNYSAANQLVKNPALKNKDYKAYIPFSCVSCKGIVKNIDPEIEIEELKHSLRSNIIILNIIRLNKRVNNNNEIQYIRTPTILITFEGTTVPRTVEVYKLSFLVFPYISPVT